MLIHFQENQDKKKKKKKKKFSLLALFKRKKKGRVTPNTSKEDLEQAENDEIKEIQGEKGTTMVNGGDTGNGIPLRAGKGCCNIHFHQYRLLTIFPTFLTRPGSGESTRSETESVANGTTIDGDPSQPSFPVSVVVDETMQSKNNGTPFEKADSSERLNVANGNGGVPNGNSHKGQLAASWSLSSICVGCESARAKVEAKRWRKRSDARQLLTFYSSFNSRHLWLHFSKGQVLTPHIHRAH